ncbi:MAG: hypothetical protein A3B89_04010 [Candidatus Buchananbacteria bacterium RIFCSPHIGHO2_02_FULL_40_13]|uniref:Methyltransferase type 11 domain-containing protein n=1 Tax=Candidatus Buchananbacteria bacterium RIFCSPLOWO2_01_FULL_39_33 TaxID=1797543 RepID=A0A1G1YK58_9BACT|nr:MAG: hypothetical protein A2820_02610 [Candidatus Buchananbacteria bacterium RIFCSPHIGHO2_01_FULL_40_35]OGY50723.1 MAG: hypothetical protein A3B89_04010 [Candidatus Buchananbacteria bacterium RIFCSPHIGHO2_02_FULL_40_13]OGY52654.1 MAG: hypothetical protein A3A02_03985 [Candidatus Buchananbacteria bacterium RIFCSPLOWO2_01_FULL_39_33]
MKVAPDDNFDITICSEVLEHIKEYKLEQKAINQLKLITKNDGLIIISTPNSELLENHGFSFDEINNLFKNNFSQYYIFENAFIPIGKNELLWKKRLNNENIGIIVSELINFNEAVLPNGKIPEIKQGLPAGLFKFNGYEIDTSLLHNTHSWVILAINN